MRVALFNVGKKYNRNWIFKGLNFLVESGQSIGISGPNGSGKSTLVKIVSSALTPNEGRIEYSRRGDNIALENVPFLINYTAPYIDLIENLTVKEMAEFYQNFKPFLGEMNAEDIIETAMLMPYKKLFIQELSSGMLQRFKLSLALCSQAELLLLDEPTTNLDNDGKKWFKALVNHNLGNRTCIIASNEKADFSSCEKVFSLMDLS